MYYFNQQEKVFLLSLCAVLCIGSFAQIVFKRFPHLHDIVNVVESERFYPKIDVNHASKEELIRIPYIGEYTAEKIIRYRKKHKGFRELEELKNIKGVRFKNYERFRPYLKI